METNHHPEFRQDRITQEWVACAPSRSARPHKTGSRTADTTTISEAPTEGCPFCPGHEEMLPSVLWQLDAEGKRPWMTRVVPNKYPALTTEEPPEEKTHGLYRTRTPYGQQEVVIDTSYHEEELAYMPATQIKGVVNTYLERYRALRRAEPTVYPFIFRNYGARAGASIDHPHSQIIAPAFPPPRIQREERAAHSRYEETGSCPYCTMIEHEQEVGTRIVWTNDSFVVFVPFAARVPYEMWIVPRAHRPEFGEVSDSTVTDLAVALQQATKKLHDHLDDPDYNFFIRTALAYPCEAPYLHWSVRLRPRTSVEAGFERSTGVCINPSIPERDASVLRGEE